jgi:hypothetical protein
MQYLWLLWLGSGRPCRKISFPDILRPVKCGSQPTSGFSLPASFAFLAFHFQLLTSGLSLNLFVLCLKRRTASIPTLASKGNTFTARLRLPTLLKRNG